MEAKDEVWGSIRRVSRAESIPVTQNTMPSGAVLQNAPVVAQVEFVFTFDDIRSCDTDALATQMDSAAEQQLAVVMPHFFEMVRRTSEAAGTSMNLDGRPFSFELWLEMLGKLEIDFDDRGSPDLPSMILSPELADRIRKLPPWTAEQKRAFDELIEAKRKQYNARRRNRKLR
jgi:hypothetical protein